MIFDSRFPGKQFGSVEEFHAAVEEMERPIVPDEPMVQIMKLLEHCKGQESLSFRIETDDHVANGAIPFAVLSKNRSVLFEAATMNEIIAYLTGFSHAP